MATANDIISAVHSIQTKIPYRTQFERENFLFNRVEGPRLILVLCEDLNNLYSVYENSTHDWQKTQIQEEMTIVKAKLDELIAEHGSDVAAAIESAEPAYWEETFARRGVVEALIQKVSYDNMANMLQLPMQNYEAAITKCQTYLNSISKTTRAAERKANLANMNTNNEGSAE